MENQPANEQNEKWITSLLELVHTDRERPPHALFFCLLGLVMLFLSAGFLPAAQAQNTSTTWADDNAGTDKPVTVTGLALSGSDKGNFALPDPAATTVKIGKADWPSDKRGANGSAKYGKSGEIDISALIAPDVNVSDIEFTYVKSGGEETSDMPDELAEGPYITSEDKIFKFSFREIRSYIGHTIKVILKVPESTNYFSYAITISLTVEEKDIAELVVTQEGITYGSGALPDPSYDKPAGSTETLSYTGTRRRDGSQYGPTVEKPTEAGSYKVSVRCETEETIYSGSADFTIAPEDIGSGTVKLGNALTYNGSQQTQAVAGLMLDGYDILPDCTVSSNTGTSAGEYTLTVTANENSNYTGTIQQVFTIAKKAVTPVITVSGTYTYTGKAVIPDLTAYDGETPLAETDFTAVISDNINAGTAKVTVSAADAGNYSFEPQDLTFTIAKAQVTYGDVETTVIYTAASKTVTLTCVPADAGKFELIPAAAAQTTGSVVFDGASADADAKTVLIRFSGGAVGDSITLPVTVSTENYADADVKIILKLEPQGVIDIPTAVSGLKFNGTEQTGVKPGEGYTLTGNTGTEAGNYTAAAALTDPVNTIWSDGSKDPKEIPWTIAEAADEDVEQDVVRHPLDKVPAELSGLYQTIDDLQQAMMLKLVINGKPAVMSHTQFYDVKLKISFDGGRTWMDATPENFPKDGLWVTLPYPAGTGMKTHTFGVSHMFTITSTRLGTRAGDVEYPEFQLTESGLRIKLKGLSPVAIAWSPIEPETQTIATLKFEHYQQDGTPGVPKDIPDDLTLSLILKAKKDGKTIEASAVMDTIKPENRHSQAAFGFDEDLDLADGYDFSLNFAPKTVTGKPIYGDPPIPGNTYTLTVTSLSPVEGKEAEGYCLKIMMMWDNGTRRHPDDNIAIYALPEDEIGAYVQYQDGTKEYLLFHTYDICMDWLGSDELCSGYDRCFHKENPYQNPFVK